jgi:hypothetical protein
VKEILKGYSKGGIALRPTNLDKFNKFLLTLHINLQTQLLHGKYKGLVYFSGNYALPSGIRDVYHL